MKLKKIDRGHKWVVSIVLLALLILLRLSWVYVIPYNHAPDENGHFGLMTFVAEKHKLPVSGDPELTKVAGRYSVFYGALPSLPYIFGAIGVSVGKYIVNSDNLYLFARFISVLLGIGTVFLSYRIVKLLFPDNIFIKVGVPIAVLLIPQASFIFMYANNDAITTFFMTLSIYLMTICTVKNWSVRNALFLGASLGACLLTKPNAYIIVPLTGIYLIFSFWREYKKGISYGLIIFLATAIISGWWFVRNFIIYNGDFLAIKTSNLTNGNSFKGHGGSIFSMIFHTNWIEWSFKSSWGWFDYMSLQLPQWYYYIIAIMLMLAIIGLVIYFYKIIFKKDKTNRVLLVMGPILILAIIFTNGLSLWSSYSNDYNPQGKYLYPSFVPFVIVFVFGIFHFFDYFLPKKKIYTLSAFVLLFLIMNVYSIFYLYKYYDSPLYQTNQVNLLELPIEKIKNVSIDKAQDDVVFHIIGPDPQTIIKNLNISTNAKQIMIIRFETSTNAQIYWETNNGLGFSEENSMKYKFEKGSDYVIEMGKQKGWNGVIKKIRIDPSDDINNDVLLKEFKIY